MSEYAREEIDLYLGMYSEWENYQMRVDHQGVALMAKALAIQQAGVIPMHTEPEWIKATIDGLPLESLR